ncbi:MAG: hypothetical protein ACYDAC_00660 [Candidatus Dormibacteria bacterium]
MPPRLRHRRSPGESRRDAGSALRRWTIPAIGALTPVGLIVVNIAAFIVHHLDQFRWSISVLAFVSGLMLNSWTALKIYRVARLRWPHHALLEDRNQEVVLVGGIAIITVIAFVTALFCYRGLSNAADLPNGTTFITGVVAILIPVTLQAIFSRIERRQAGVAADVSAARFQLPPPPPDRWS